MRSIDLIGEFDKVLERRKDATENVETKVQLLHIIFQIFSMLVLALSL